MRQTHLASVLTFLASSEAYQWRINLNPRYASVLSHMKRCATKAHQSRPKKARSLCYNVNLLDFSQKLSYFLATCVRKLCPACLTLIWNLQSPENEKARMKKGVTKCSLYCFHSSHLSWDVSWPVAVTLIWKGPLTPFFWPTQRFTISLPQTGFHQ